MGACLPALADLDLEDLEDLLRPYVLQCRRTAHDTCSPSRTPRSGDLATGAVRLWPFGFSGQPTGNLHQSEPTSDSFLVCWVRPRAVMIPHNLEIIQW